MMRSRFAVFIIFLGLLAGQPALLAGGAKKRTKITTHDQLTERWRPEDYKLKAKHGLTCCICFGENTAGVTTEGCDNHFSDETMGTCDSCLHSMELVPQLLGKGLYHSHDLPDGTQHNCLITAGNLLDAMAEDGTLAELDEVENFRKDQPEFYALYTSDPAFHQKLKDQRKELRKGLQQAKTKSRHRKLLQQQRSNDSSLRRVTHLRRLAAIREWATELRSQYRAQSGRREDLAKLKALCGTCGCYPKAWAGEAAILRATALGTWTQSCPACGDRTTLVSTAECSIHTCRECLKASGEATRSCVVCRKTSRGDTVLFPGKPGSDHTRCVEILRAHVADPGEVGHFDVCACPDGEDSKRN
jgi:hypothetical protein